MQTVIEKYIIIQMDYLSIRGVLFTKDVEVDIFYNG